MNTSAVTTKKTAPSADDLSKQIEALRADLAKLATMLSDDVTEGIGNAGRRIGRAGRDAQTTATEAVAEHPLTAVGIAAGVGFLLGTIARKA